MKSGQSAHINLIWSPIKNVNAGIEYMVLKRVNGDNASGVGQRMQLMAKYIFQPWTMKHPDISFGGPASYRLEFECSFN